MLRTSAAARVLTALTLASMYFGRAWPDELPKPGPGKKIHVFLFAGQSNMEGRADGAN